MRLLRRVLLPALATAGAVLYVQKVHRFRDPVRFSPDEAGVVLSPSDGVVSFVRRVDLGRIENFDPEISTLVDAPIKRQDGWLIGVVMRPLDVHYTYQPIAGTVRHIHHRAGDTEAIAAQKLLRLMLRQPTDLLEASGTANNERYSYTVQSDLGDITVTQVSLRSALQPLTFVEEGQSARAGNKASFLPNGGLILVHLPALVAPQVEVGQEVRGGETVLGRRSS